jgi:hypothetical protein
LTPEISSSRVAANVGEGDIRTEKFAGY